MAAISAVLRLLRPEPSPFLTEGLYGQWHTLVKFLLEPAGLLASFVDTTSPEAVRAAWTDKTRAIFAEVPTNPLLRVSDLAALSEIAKENRVSHCRCDFLTRWTVQPLKLGADIVIHSATKYLAGHNDTMAGAVVVKSPSIAEELSFIQIMTGGILSPLTPG